MGGDDGGKMEGVMRWWLEAHWMGGAPVVFLVEDDDVWCQRWDLRRWKSLAADNWEEATVKLCLSAVQLYLSCVSSLTCYDGRQRLRGGGGVHTHTHTPHQTHTHTQEGVSVHTCRCAAQTNIQLCLIYYMCSQACLLKETLSLPLLLSLSLTHTHTHTHTHHTTCAILWQYIMCGGEDRGDQGVSSLYYRWNANVLLCKLERSVCVCVCVCVYMCVPECR